jgi:hypothetical protein
MKASELRQKLAAKKAGNHSASNAAADSCSWNPMGEEAPFSVQLELIKGEEGPDREDSGYEDDGDDEQNFKEALSLLDTARDLLLASAQFLDARHLTLPGDQDWAVTVTCSDIRQFLHAFDYQKIPIKAPTKKPTELGPQNVSHECRHTHHEKCPLIKCDCFCHAHELLGDAAHRAATNYMKTNPIEVIREHISHTDDKLDVATAPL